MERKGREDCGRTCWSRGGALNFASMTSCTTSATFLISLIVRLGSYRFYEGHDRLNKSGSERCCGEFLSSTNLRIPLISSKKGLVSGRLFFVGLIY
jgi:hypothetical protein